MSSPPGVLHELQAGGLKGADCEVLLLTLLEEHPERLFPYGFSLVFAKAFDSCDYCIIALEVFRHVGIPPSICAGLRAQWEAHTRWVTYGKIVCKEPIRHAQTLLFLSDLSA